MATRAKAQAQTPAPTAQPAAPAASLPAFGLLVTGAMCAWRAEQSAKASAPPFSPTESQTQAWSLLTSPKRAALLALDAHDVKGLFPRNTYDWRDLSGSFEIAPGFTPPDIDLLTRATRDAAAALRSVARSDAFKLAAHAYAPLLATASADQLSYPLFARALRVGKPSSDGGSLGAHKIPTRGTGEQFDRVSAEWARGALDKLPANSARDAALGEAELAEQAAARAKAAADQDTDRLPYWALHNLRDDAVLGFAAVVAPGAQGSRLRPETPFPDVFEASRALDAAIAADGFDPNSARPAQVAAGALRTAAEHAATLFLAPRSALDASTRHARLGLERGPLAQAGFSAMDFEGIAPLSKLVQPLARLAWALLPPPSQWKDMPLRPIEAGDEPAARPDLPGELQNDFEDLDDAETNFQDDRLPAYISARLTALSKTPATLDKALERALRASDSQIEKHSKAAASLDIHAYSPFELNQHIDEHRALPKRWKEKIPTLEGVAETLSKASPLIGVCQWAAAQALALFNARDPEDNSHQDNPARRAAHIARISLAHGRSELASALDDFSAARAELARSFAQAATAAASVTEKAWLSERGLLPAWEQARATGSISGASVAWATANPMGASLASSDSVARLAAISARALGLRAGDGEPELRASYVAELAERGATPDGLALLETEPGIQALFAKLAAADFSDKLNHAARLGALDFCCHALSACSSMSMPVAHAREMLLAYAARPCLVFAQSAAVPGGSHAQFDGLAPGVGDILSPSAEASRLALELGRAKALHFPRMVQALAEDWSQTLSAAAALGRDESFGLIEARSRASTIRERFPVNGQIDWRKNPFDSIPAWQLLAMDSPRLPFAISDAQARGGAIGAWCASHADEFGVVDAADGNDLVGRCRDFLKNEFGLADGAWKIALKSTELLDEMAQIVQVHRESSIPHKDFELAASHLLRHSKDRYDFRGFRSNPRSSLGVALSAAAHFSVAPATADKVARLLVVDEDCADLFSDALPPMKVSGPQGAQFHLAECKAKAARQSKIFVEACRRFEKLAADSSSGKRAEGQALIDPLQALGEEAIDLRDWIRGSEAGLWQTLPPDPTWGQLRRLSKAWHDERHAEQVDRDARAAARKGTKVAADADPEFQAAVRANPFVPTGAARWAKLLGRHERDGWEAVELASAADLSEEGAQMHHCVSSYSATCRAGTSRIFSVRLNGERKCTLEIAAESPLHQLGASPEFKIRQNKGKHNAAITNEATVAFCRETLHAVRKIWPEHRRKIDAALAREKAEREERLKAALAARKEQAATAEAGIPQAQAPTAPKKNVKAGSPAG